MTCAGALLLLLLPALTEACSEGASAEGGGRCVCGGGARVCGGAAERRAAAGAAATLACTLHAATSTELQVSWVRSRDLQILAHAGAVFTGDSRVGASSRGRTHQLRLGQVRQGDAGVYKCSVNTEPSISLHYNLIVEDTTPHIEVSAWREETKDPASSVVTLVCGATIEGGAGLQLAWRGPRAGGVLAAGVARDSRQWPGGAETRLALPRTSHFAGTYQCLATLTDRADDAPPKIATVTVDADEFAETAEAMQSDQSASGAVPLFSRHLSLALIVMMMILSTRTLCSV